MADVQHEVAWGRPTWTQPMYSPSTGRDHLGLASVSQDRILPQLSPAINVLTIHPRYWSVYLWLLVEFWERELPRTATEWGRFLKPRERIFVAAVLSCPEHGTDIPEVGGKRRVGKEVEAEVAAFDPTAPYLKDPRGGYPIYASAIAEMGLSILERDTPQLRCDAPTETGREIGLALKAWVEDTDYYRLHFGDGVSPVPAELVHSFAERVCLCRLVDGPDQPLLLDAFLHGGDGEAAQRRRTSLRLICDISSQTAAEAVDGWGFRQLVYYRSDDAGRSYEPYDADLLTQARRWRLFQQRELVAWSLNRWLRHLTDWGIAEGGDQVPLTWDRVFGTVERADFAGLADALGAARPAFDGAAPLSQLITWATAEGRIDDDLDASWDLNAPLCEERVWDHMWDLRKNDDEVPAAVMTLLVLCASRTWSLQHRLRYAADWGLVRAGGARRLAVEQLVDDLRAKDAAGATINEVGRFLLERYVIRQHHRVALAKLPDDTFRLRIDGGAVQFMGDPVAVEPNDPRFRALSFCAAELGLIGRMDGDGHGLRPLGRTLLESGDVTMPASRSHG